MKNSKSPKHSPGRATLDQIEPNDREHTTPPVLSDCERKSCGGWDVQVSLQILQFWWSCSKELARRPQHPCQGSEEARISTEFHCSPTWMITTREMITIIKAGKHSRQASFFSFSERQPRTLEMFGRKSWRRFGLSSRTLSTLFASSLKWFSQHDILIYVGKLKPSTSLFRFKPFLSTSTPRARGRSAKALVAGYKGGIQCF